MFTRLVGIALVACLACSAAPRATPSGVPAPVVPSAAAEGSLDEPAAPRDAATLDEAPLDEAARAELAAQLEELATLGTGASLAVGLDGRVVPFVTGTLFADGPRVASTSRFNVASVSKLMTAAKIIQLAHAEKLSLTDSVKTHLRAVRFVDAGGHDRADRITLEQLLMHRGGLPHSDPAFDPASFGSTWQDPALLTKMTQSWTLALKNEPGTYGYSNFGYATLAAVIEATEGCSFADCMSRFLADTLGMKSATMWPPSLERDDPQEADAAHGRAVKDGEVVFLTPGWYGTRIAVPYTGLWISMPDLARFGQRLLTAKKDPHDPLHAMTTGIPDGEKGHGRGPVHSRRGEHATMRHDGSGPGFLAFLVAVPDEDLTMAVAVNGGGDTKEGVAKLREVTDAMLGTLGVAR